MSMALSTFPSKTPVVKFAAPKISLRIAPCSHSFSFGPPSLASNTKPLKKTLGLRDFYNKYFDGLPVKSRGCTVKAQDENGGDANEEMEARGQSSMPERFRHLTKEAPDKPLRWHWLIVLAFMVYAWRAVLWELFNWRKVAGGIGRFLGYIPKLVLALIFHFIGDPVTSLIRILEETFYTIRASYSGIIAYAPISDLTLIIVLTSAVLAVGEASVPGSVETQPYVLTTAGLIGFAAVRNCISELLFWTLLVGLFGFVRLVKKKDYVSSALPVAAVLAAVGEPWVRVIAMGSYLWLAVSCYKGEGSGEGERKRVVLFPLLCAAMAIGVRVAAKWAGYRHLTWMVV